MTQTLPSACERVASELRARIGAAWKPGDRLPPIQNIASELGIGLQTAHRAVRDLVDSGLLVTRPRHGTFVATDALAHLKVGPLAGKTVRIISRRMFEGMIRVMSDEAESVLTSQGARVVHAELTPQNSWEATEQADAAVVINPSSWPELSPEPACPFVVISTATGVPVGRAEGYDTVGVDQEQGGVLAGQFFRSLRVQNPLFLGARNRRPGFSGFGPASLARLQGFEAGLGRQIPEDHKILCEYYRPEFGAQAVGRFLALPQRPDAIFAASDELAVGFILGGLAHGLTPGVDYRIIGFDRQTAGSNLMTGRLTSIEVPSGQLGQRAGQLLAERLGNPSVPVRKLSLGCRLWLGDTTPEHFPPTLKKETP